MRSETPAAFDSAQGAAFDSAQGAGRVRRRAVWEKMDER
jgi:hypothetical protein